MINLFDLQTERKLLTPCDDFRPIGQIYQKSMNDSYKKETKIPRRIYHNNLTTNIRQTHMTNTI